MLTTATIQSFLLVSHEAEKFPSCRFSESVLSRRGYHVALQLPFFEFLEREVERPRSSLESLSLSLYLSSLSGSSTIFPDSSRSIITFSSFLLASSKTTTRSRIEEDVVSSCPCPAHQEESSDSNTLLVRIVTRYSGGDSFQFPFLPFWINAILASRKSRNREGLNCGKLIQRNRSQ